VKAVILAGGRGTRISEETDVRPKPMIEIGGRPIVWHIMKLYTAHGVTDFVICLGYKGYLIKEYFANYHLHVSDVTFDVGAGSMEVHQNAAEPWRVTLIDTGEETMTGGRLKRVARYLDDGDFCFTYGDGVSDLDISATIEFHRSHGRLGTVTAVRPPSRFGVIETGDDDRIERFREKPRGEGGWINGGFFVLSPKVLDYIEGDATAWEQEPMTRLAEEGQLVSYRHEGFWYAMDTVRDRMQLEEMWDGGRAPWRVWDEI
jgi:glucose-1-phosphate cytidylyltransferase